MKETDKKPKEFNEGKCLLKLRNKYELGKQYYGRIHKKMQLLDATDKGDLWKALGAKFPPYQVLPDTNAVSYVKNNILASLYTVAKTADIVPTSESDTSICTQLSVALEHEFDTHKIGYYEFCAGERAALLNMGITQVRWVNDDLTFANIDPLHFMRDPFADSLENAGWCTTYNSYHVSVFENNPLYKEKFKEIKPKLSPSTEMSPEYKDRSPVAGSSDHYNLFIFWVKNDEGGINEYHTLDFQHVLHKHENIKPNVFPFAELYCNLPGSNLVGVSEPSKIFANDLVYNMMQSISFTAEYKNQRPPKFVSRQSLLNINAFSKHGNEADRTFIVNGDASRAVHYHQFPQTSPTLPNMLSQLSRDIQSTSGVDGRYTGRETGSITTTGGTEEMLNRVTLIDTPKVMCYEDYVCRLTKLVLKFLLEHAPKRKYLVKDPKSTPTNVRWVTEEVDFPTIDSDTVFEYTVQVSSELPKNKQRIQAWADTMMEKQMQYNKDGTQLEIITPEEWLRMQDVPYKEQMLERMGVARSLNAYVETNNVVGEFAQMVEQGMSSEEALALAAQGLENLRKGQPTPLEEQQQMVQGAPMPTDEEAIVDDTQLL